ncbi:MAG: hypothetical protein ABFR05_11865 [Bacteroidota bacterium]
MDNYLALPEEQLLFYTHNINDIDIIEKAKEQGHLELYDLLEEESFISTAVYV